MTTVGDVMTPATGLVAVPSELTAQRVDDLALELGIRHVFVADGRQLSGLLCRCDLQAPERRETPVGALMATRFWSASPATALQKAASVMARERIGCLPVVDADDLVGVITRGDLRRAGVAESLLGAGHCASCGDVHGVLPLWDDSDVEFCLSCIDVVRQKVDDAEIGTGD